MSNLTFFAGFIYGIISCKYIFPKFDSWLDALSKRKEKSNA